MSEYMDIPFRGGKGGRVGLKKNIQCKFFQVVLTLPFKTTSIVSVFEFKTTTDTFFRNRILVKVCHKLVSKAPSIFVLLGFATSIDIFCTSAS